MPIEKWLDYIVYHIGIKAYAMLLKIMCICMFAIVLTTSKCTETNLDYDMDKEIILQILHYKIPCVGESAQLCYSIKNNKGEREFFYDEIKDFNYEWGYNYLISVEKIQAVKPMQDASSFRFKLKTILKKEKASSEDTFELPLQIDDNSFVEATNGTCSLLGKISIDVGKYSCEDLAKAPSAFFKHNTRNPGLVLISIK